MFSVGYKRSMSWVLVCARTCAVLALASAARSEETFRTTPELVLQHGHSVESHSVLTEDGYILTLHRLLPRDALDNYLHATDPEDSTARHTVFGLQDDVASPGDRPAVLLQHGVLASSLDWVLPGTNKALGYKLCEAGYDVWLGNLRGNLYSREHINLTTKEAEFWNFSWHEIGMFDVPAMVDHILRVTGQPSLHFIGHSMGATVAVVMLSERPHYNRKLRVTVLLAPVIRLMHNTSVFRFSAPFWKTFETVTRYGAVHSFPPSDVQVQKQFAPMCEMQYIGPRICARFLNTVAGYGKNLDTTLLPVLFSHYPTQTSVKTMCHFMQGMNTGRFCKYDYGSHENSRRYNSSEPSEYELFRITSPVAIFVGDSDPFTEPQDMTWLDEALPNLIGNFRVAAESFSHLSFLWSTDADAVLYDPVIRLLTLYRHY